VCEEGAGIIPPNHGQFFSLLGDNQNPNIHFVGAETTFCPKMPPKTTPTSTNYTYTTLQQVPNTQFQHRQMKSLA
jgi:hypothetical protein